ncbi:MAG: ribose-5-phosphate isomerase RpiA [Gammaproteobacteria bacterium]|nr:MAG: ribose-5-phosphate isomerase RpiA [Gammaproteobacteria bacterium]TDJ45046.1 MAG: ribose-5-phosphate isomerase RpiA [Gammaproteobacteria bacterium]
MNQDDKKRQAAEAAISQIEPGISLGVGTGSTVNFFIDALAGHALNLTTVVSSSEASTEKLQNLGVEVSDLASAGDLDVYVDGADEATKHLHLIKGGGGALTREKILAGASRKFICIIDDSKLMGILGRFPLPVEVIPMAQSFVARQLIKAGGQPIWRTGFVTDNGNHILDVHNLSIPNPLEVENRLNQIPGVVTVGIFAQRHADVLLVGGDNGVREMR